MNKSRAILLVTLAVISLSLNAQDRDLSITVTGNVKAEKKFSRNDLHQFTVQPAGDLPITNYKGDLKGTAKSLKGVLLRDILSTVALTEENPKFFSEFYFVCKATDGYTVVCSWNELFNTKTGDSAYIITEKDGADQSRSDDAFLMVSAQDVRTGRRYVKNLETIYVGRAE